MTHRQTRWLANGLTLVALLGAEVLARPWWLAVPLVAVIGAAGIANFAEGRIAHNDAEALMRADPEIGVIDPHSRYTLAGLGGVWAVTGMSTRNGHAEVTLILAEEWERLRDAS
jgi:hypothetical protein